MFDWSAHLVGRPCQAAVAVGDKVYTFGDTHTRSKNWDYKMYKRPKRIAVQVFNTVSLCWTTLAERPYNVPCLRRGFTAVLIEGVVYLWGGMYSLTNTALRTYYNVLYAFDVDPLRWFKPQVSGTVPEARKNHSACVLGKVMYIYGGCTQIGCSNRYSNDMYKLDTATMGWSLINTRGTPAAISYYGHHSATIIGTKMFWGGSSGATRVFDTETNCWLDTPSAQPLPEGRTCLSTFAYNGEQLCISGGKNSSTNVWKLDPDSLSWKKLQLTGKGYSGNSKVRCCVARDRIILFSSDDDHRSHLHILDLTSLKTLCKLAVMQYGLERSGLPHNIRWELSAASGAWWCSQ